MTRVAVIPARGGSKRIPRKNVREFCGKPMIAWSIEAARQSGSFDDVIVSTDDAEIADVAQRSGASVPFIRPTELSDDHTGTLPVMRHAIEAQRAAGCPHTEVCLIYATAPFVRPEDLREACSLLDAEQCDYVLSVTSFEAPIQRALRLDSAGRIDMFQPEHFHTRSQDLEPAYHDAGQFCWGTAEAWLSGKAVFARGSRAYVLPRNRVQDIDTPEDWARAESLFRALHEAS